MTIHKLHKDTFPLKNVMDQGLLINNLIIFDRLVEFNLEKVCNKTVENIYKLQIQCERLSIYLFFN